MSSTIRWLSLQWFDTRESMLLRFCTRRCNSDWNAVRYFTRLILGDSKQTPPKWDQRRRALNRVGNWCKLESLLPHTNRKTFVRLRELFSKGFIFYEEDGLCHFHEYDTSPVLNKLPSMRGRALSFNYVQFIALDNAQHTGTFFRYGEKQKKRKSSESSRKSNGNTSSIGD